MVLVSNANQLKQQITTINSVTKTSAIIPIGSLVKGQSGIIIHDFKDDKSSIIASAIVTSSSANSSTISFEKIDIFNQTAIPTTNSKPTKGDTFILNHLYNTSLLIVPNHNAKVIIQKRYPNNNFIDIDIFAAFLKINDKPVPTKEDIVNFSKHNNIGTLYLQTNDKLHIVDVLSFQVVKTESLVLDSNKTQSPFFTNVQDIKTSLFSWFSQENIKDYHKYYTNLIGIKNDRK